MNSKQKIIDGILTSYLVSDNFDKGNCLLFLHGRGQSKSAFSKIFKLLDKENISYISLDLPGFGGTSIPKNTWGIADYSDFVIQFIEANNLVKPSLVCHSFGGRIGIFLGSSYENLGKIILIGAAGIKPKQKIVQKIGTNIGKKVFSLPGLKGIGSKIKQKIGSEDYKNAGKLKDIFVKVVNEDLTDNLPKIDNEVLLIWGEKDEATSLENGKKMNQLIKNSKLVTFANGTHFVYDEFAEEVWREIRNFVFKR